MSVSVPTSLDDLFRPLQDLLNRGIADSSDASRLCRELEGKSLALDLEGLPMGLRFVASDGGVIESSRCTVTWWP